MNIIKTINILSILILSIFNLNFNTLQSAAVIRADDNKKAQKARDERRLLAAIADSMKSKPKSDSISSGSLTKGISSLKPAKKIASEEKKEKAAEFTIKNIAIVPLVVPFQKGADCGFHAFNNVIETLKSIYDGKMSPPLGFSDLEDIRAYIITAHSKEDWLEIEQLNSLMKHSKYSRIANQSNIFIIDRIVQAEPVTTITNPFLTSQPNCDLLGAAFENLRTKKFCFYGFILGTMRQVENRTTSGHWICVIAYKEDNTLTYYVMDSLESGAEIRRNLLIPKLDALIKHSNCEILKFAKFRD